METEYKVEFTTDTDHTWEQTFPTARQAERRAVNTLGMETAHGTVYLTRLYRKDAVSWVFDEEYEF